MSAPPETRVTAYFTIRHDESETFTLELEPDDIGYAEVQAELNARYPFDDVELDDYEVAE